MCSEFNLVIFSYHDFLFRDRLLGDLSAEKQGGGGRKRHQMI